MDSGSRCIQVAQDRVGWNQLPEALVQQWIQLAETLCNVSSDCLICYQNRREARVKFKIRSSHNRVTNNNEWRIQLYTYYSRHLLVVGSRVDGARPVTSPIVRLLTNQGHFPFDRHINLVGMIYRTPLKYNLFINLPGNWTLF